MQTITNELACGHGKSTIPDIFTSLSNIRSHLAVAWTSARMGLLFSQLSLRGRCLLHISCCCAAAKAVR
jgi:hypothetical protein